MSENNILEYVDSVMSKIDVPDNQKIQVENELMRYIMNSVENTSMEEVKDSLTFPEKVADEISKKLAFNIIEARRNEYLEPDRETYHHKKHHHAYAGELMQEFNNLNLKLLYIPLIQISSGTTRLVMPLTDDDDD